MSLRVTVAKLIAVNQFSMRGFPVKVEAKRSPNGYLDGLSLFKTGPQRGMRKWFSSSFPLPDGESGEVEERERLLVMLLQTDK